MPPWVPLAGPEGGHTNIVPVDFIAKSMDHIAHMSDDDLPGDCFHLVESGADVVGAASTRSPRRPARTAVRDAVDST